VDTLPHWPQRRPGFGVDPSSFYSVAKDKLGGSVSAAEDQALAAMNSWASDAQQAVLSYLDPDQQGLISTAIQGVQDFASGGLNSQTFFAVAGLVATSIGGPVAGALVGSMALSLQVIGDAFMGVARTLGIAATAQPAVDPRALCGASGWVFHGQQIPMGPDDTGNGTYNDPGWQSVWNQVQTIIGPTVACGTGNLEANLGAARARLPAALNNVLAVSSDAYLIPWCELQQVPQTDFLWFFYSLLYSNLDNAYNCVPVAAVDEQDLLKAAAKVWNAAHSNATAVQYTARDDWPFAGHESAGLTLQHILAGLAPGYGPDAQKQHMAPLVINTGPLLSTSPTAAARSLISLRLAGSSTTSIGLPIKSAPSGAATATKIAAGVAVVGGAALVGTAIYALVKKETIGGVWGGIWKGAKKPFRR
jgi:hypothetical protein